MAVTDSGGRYRTTSETTTTERYTYDAAGRLETTQRDGLTIDVRRYDAAGRITQAGLLVKGDAGVTDVLGQLGIAASGRIYSYDAGGHITRQRSAHDTFFVIDA